MSELDDRTRRSFIVGSTLLGAALSQGLPALAASGDVDPRKDAQGQAKLAGDLDGGPAPWWFTGSIYAVQENKPPVLLLHPEGCETYWMKRRDDGGYDVKGTTLTFFRDPVTGAYLDSYHNPLTGKVNTVAPNFLSGGSGFIPPDGGPQRMVAPPKSGGQVAPGGFKTLTASQALGPARWVVSGDTVIYFSDKAVPVPVQPYLELSSYMCDSASFFDPRVRRVRGAKGSATFISPYLRWMEMQGVPGHTVWSVVSHKLDSFDALPEDYRARAQKLFPGRLTRMPS